MALTDKLTAIADAVRLQSGKTEKLSLGQMPEEIANLHSLNFKVVGNPKPDAPQENTIWIDTDSPVNGYTLSADAPAEPVEGMVRIFTEADSAVPFSATKKNPIMVYPHAAYQYIGGAWVQKPAQTYMDDAWQDWYTYLFNAGQVNDELTGGINGTFQDGGIYFSGKIDKSYNKTFTTKQKIDITRYNILNAIVESDVKDNMVYFRLLTTTVGEKNGSRVVLDDLKAYNSAYAPFAGEVREVHLDISSETGLQYVGYAWGVNSDASGSKSVSGRILRWWLE